MAYMQKENKGKKGRVKLKSKEIQKLSEEKE